MNRAVILRAADIEPIPCEVQVLEKQFVKLVVPPDRLIPDKFILCRVGFPDCHAAVIDWRLGNSVGARLVGIEPRPSWYTETGAK